MNQNDTRASSFVTLQAVIWLSEKIRDSSVSCSVQDVKATIKGSVSHTAEDYRCHLVAGNRQIHL